MHSCPWGSGDTLCCAWFIRQTEQIPLTSWCLVHFPEQVSFFPNQPQSFSLYHVRQEGNYFFPTSLRVWYIYFSFLSPSPHCQMLNGLSLLVRRMGWLLWQLEVTLLSKGLCFTFGASLMNFKWLFIAEFNHLLPLSCLKKGWDWFLREKTEELLLESRKPHVGSKAWLKVLGLFGKLSLSCNLFWLVIWWLWSS